jgi:ferredoxin
MPRFFFDIRDGDSFTSDDEGLEFGDIEQAQREASETLADMAKDAIRNGALPKLAIDVRANGEPLLRTTLKIEVQRLR